MNLPDGYEPSEAVEDTLDSRRHEVAEKVAAVRTLLEQHGADAVMLTTIASTAWITAGGATFVNESVDTAILTAFITADSVTIVTDSIEAPRLNGEEHLDELGFVVMVEPWYARGQELNKLVSGKRVANETAPEWVALQRDLSQLRATLHPNEQARLRAGSTLAAQAMRHALLAVKPGMTEAEAAAQLMLASRHYGGTPVVTLVGSDDRIFTYRHPIATAKVIEKYAMLVLCFRFHGLVISLTRSVYFGELPDDLRETAMAVAKVDAHVIAATQEGHTLAGMFDFIKEQYAAAGQPHAIEEHHQGGTAGYLGREGFAIPTATDWVIKTGQSFAWNPSIRGAKSEDTVLLTATGPEVTTVVANWPMWNVVTPRGFIARPAILEVLK